MVFKSPLIFHAIRSEDAVCITLISCVPWLPSEFEANVIIVVADDGKMWQALQLLRSSIEWAKDRQCTYWKIAGDTEYDLGPVARRLGAEEILPRYCQRLK